MNTEICKITFPDGAWLKAELPTGDERIEYVLDHFGMFKEIEALPTTDAAVIVANAKAPQLIADRKDDVASIWIGQDGNQWRELRCWVGNGYRHFTQRNLGNGVWV